MRADDVIVLQRVAGKNATKQFQKYHREAILGRYKENLKVGIVNVERKKERGLFWWKRKS